MQGFGAYEEFAKVRDGKIAEVRAYRTKAEAVRAIGLEA